MFDLEGLQIKLKNLFSNKKVNFILAKKELTLEIEKENLLEVINILKTDQNLKFHQLIDLCGVDYSQYGVSNWKTESATNTGYSRAQTDINKSEFKVSDSIPKRFAVVYHLLSLSNNIRLRVRVFLSEPDLMVDSLTDIFSCANWYEREAFDLYGILFKNHPDLRRILTDYGFVGHPLRKDFPLSGEVEVRYDEKEERVLYEPTEIVPRPLMAKVIREDDN